MFNQIFCNQINYLINQVPLGNFWTRGPKWDYMTKYPCHALAIVIRIFSYWLRNPKWAFIAYGNLQTQTLSFFLPVWLTLFPDNVPGGSRSEAYTLKSCL